MISFVVVAASVIEADAASAERPKRLARSRPPLHGVLVVIDPGHGGRDEGASGVVDGRRVVEDEHVYDIALRLSELILRSGGTPVLTVVDAQQQRPRENRRGRPLPPDRSERIAGVARRWCPALEGGIRCLDARLAVARAAFRRGRHQRAVWISIHYDVGSPTTEGAVVIVPVPGATPAAEAVAAALGVHPDRTRQRDGDAADDILESGDREHGIRRLFVLSGANPISERMLLELGNFRNQEDLWRIRDPRVRDDFARRIARGLIAWATPRPVRARPESTKLGVR